MALIRNKRNCGVALLVARWLLPKRGQGPAEPSAPMEPLAEATEAAGE